MHRLLVFLFLGSLAAAAPPAKDRIQAILGSSPAAGGAFWGIHVTNARTGKVLYSLNGNKFFVPASNTKLFSTALALFRLGPDYRFVTRVTSPAGMDAAGTLRGDLRLLGGGDPTLSGRDLPYHKGVQTSEPLGAIRDLADQVASRGIRRVDGDILGDDTAWPWDPYPPGWAQDDTVSEDGAPVSALTLTDNRVRIQLTPAAAGASPLLEVVPPFSYFFFRNQVRTVERGTEAVKIYRSPGSREVQLEGTLNAARGSYVDYLAVDDPAAYAATALREALIAKGITVRGTARAVHRHPGSPAFTRTGEQVLAERHSAPLLETLRVIDKVSQNLHAEMVLRETARVTRGDGARELALEELAGFLAEIGVPKTAYRFEDGSGLSRLTVVTPSGITRLLGFLYGSRYREQWLSLLPIGGQDGSLEKRFVLPFPAPTVLAKTGSLSHVAALSGYGKSRDGSMLAFSVLVNNYNSPASEIRPLIDRIVLSLVDLE